MISVIIVEDDAEIRESLAIIITGTAGFSCVGTAASGEKALALIAETLPDVVLMDIGLPGMSGIDCVREIKHLYPEIDVIMLTVHEENEAVFKSLCAGACGYLTKNTQPAKLLEAISEAHFGGAPMNTKIARMVVNSFRRDTSAGLTAREKEVLDLLCQGKSYKMIAGSLFVSQDTVRSHIKNIYRKLQVNSKSEAVAKALRERFV